MPRPLTAVAAMLVAASLGVVTSNLAHSAKSSPAAAPSQLDYLVLASMADSQQMLSMATYQPDGNQPKR